jgi:hypothetical protein
MVNMKQVNVSNRDLTIMVKVDGLTADQIAAKLSYENGIHINGEDVVALIKERGIQQKNIKRSTNFVFVNPEELPMTNMEEAMELVAATAHMEDMSASVEERMVTTIS